MYDWKIDQNWEEDQKREGTARHKIFYIFFPIHVNTVVFLFTLKPSKER